MEVLQVPYVNERQNRKLSTCIYSKTFYITQKKIYIYIYLSLLQYQKPFFTEWGNSSTSNSPQVFHLIPLLSFQMDQSCLCSAGYGHMESQAVEALDLPAPTCFRSRSHSYVCAIQAGCSQEDDSDSDEPPLHTDSNTSSESHSLVLQMYTVLSKKSSHLNKKMQN